MENFDIDSICDRLSNTYIEYDERNELFEFITLKNAGKAELIKTDERYLRYLRGVSVWEINGVSYDYIRDNINLYLSIETNDSTLLYKLNLMRQIDKQLKDAVDTTEY